MLRRDVVLADVRLGAALRVPWLPPPLELVDEVDRRHRAVVPFFVNRT